MILFLNFWCFSMMVFDFTQCWVDGRPSNEYFWIPHKISDLLAPLTPLGVCPQYLLIISLKMKLKQIEAIPPSAVWEWTGRGVQKVWKCAYIIYEWPQRKMDEDRHIMMRCFESRNDTPTYDQKTKIDVHRRLKSNTEYRQQSNLKQNMRLPAAVCSLKSKPEKLIT